MFIIQATGVTGRIRTLDLVIMSKGGATTLSITTVRITTVCLTTLRITTVSITTLSPTIKNATLSTMARDAAKLRVVYAKSCYTECSLC